MTPKSRKAIIQAMLKAHSMYYICKLSRLRNAQELWLSQLFACMNIALDVSYYENDDAMLMFYRACKRVVL